MDNRFWEVDRCIGLEDPEDPLDTLDYEPEEDDLLTKIDVIEDLTPKDNQDKLVIDFKKINDLDFSFIIISVYQYFSMPLKLQIKIPL